MVMDQPFPEVIAVGYIKRFADLHDYLPVITSTCQPGINPMEPMLVFTGYAMKKKPLE
jgi:hypothetical protein